MIDVEARAGVGAHVGAVVGLALLACVGAPASAALPNPLADGLRQCASESDQAKRLTCFDALAAGLPKVEADQFGLTADIARKRQPQVKQPGTTAAGGTGTNGTLTAGTTTTITANTVGSATRATAGTAGTMGAATPNKAEAKPHGEVLPGKITALRQASGGVLVFTLDNNQVWAQADADTRFSFKVGDDVRIEHGAMGSFWLAATKGRKTKVKRVS